jgi:hypothetical protein
MAELSIKNFPEDLLKRLKIVAAQQDITLRDLVINACYFEAGHLDEDNQKEIRKAEKLGMPSKAELSEQYRRAVIQKIQKVGTASKRKGELGEEFHRSLKKQLLAPKRKAK